MKDIKPGTHCLCFLFVLNSSGVREVSAFRTDKCVLRLDVGRKSDVFRVINVRFEEDIIYLQFREDLASPKTLSDDGQAVTKRILGALMYLPFQLKKKTKKRENIPRSI